MLRIWVVEYNRRTNRMAIDTEQHKLRLLPYGKILHLDMAKQQQQQQQQKEK